MIRIMPGASCAHLAGGVDAHADTGARSLLAAPATAGRSATAVLPVPPQVECRTALAPASPHSTQSSQGEIATEGSTS